MKVVYSLKALFVVLLISVTIPTFSQETYGIYLPDSDRATEVCTEFQRSLERFPYDAKPNVDINNGRIRVYFRGQQYFDQLFTKGSDGLAVDIVAQEQFNCGSYDETLNQGVANGKLLKPMFRKDLLKNKREQDGYVIIDYGPLPADVDPSTSELNLILVRQKFRCEYIANVKVDFANWDLLDIGLYRDVVDPESVISSKAISKTMEFIIPFEKNVAEYDAASIKPLYDSLELTDYNIIEMDIKAYTSVEGTLKRNIELQQQRAQSVVAALQTYQSPEIVSNVSAAENWVEFLDDIQNSSFEYMERLTKKEIKKELTGQTLKELEPTLSAHRKARIVLRLQKKFSAAENDPEQLLKFYDQSLAEEDVNQALYLQEIAFEKVLARDFPKDFLGRLEVPRETKYSPLLNNSVIFRNELGDDDLYETIKRFEDLEALVQGNPKVKYNIASLRLQAWREGQVLVDHKSLRADIKQLDNSIIETELVNRLWVNYYLILTAYHYQDQQHDAVRQDLKQVMFFYDEESESDQDLLSIAKFLGNYGQYGKARKLIHERSLRLEANEDLIFFFISLTIYIPQWTEQPSYRTLMVNALDKNPERFCQLFQSVNMGGVSFQILDDEYLRFTFCESCQDISTAP